MGCLTTNMMITLLPQKYTHIGSQTTHLISSPKILNSTFPSGHFLSPPCWSMIQLALALSASLQSLSSKAGVGDAPSITMAHKNFGT